MVVAAYVEEFTRTLAPASVKQYLAAIRMLFDWLVVGQILPFNPASSVRGAKHVVKEGKTPVLSAEERNRGQSAVYRGRSREGAKCHVERFRRPCGAIPGRRFSSVRLMCSHARGETWVRDSAWMSMSVFPRARIPSPHFRVFQ